MMVVSMEVVLPVSWRGDHVSRGYAASIYGRTVHVWAGDECSGGYGTEIVPIQVPNDCSFAGDENRRIESYRFMPRKLRHAD